MMAPRKKAQFLPAEISLAHLQTCLVKLPASLYWPLVNAGTVSSRPRNEDPSALQPVEVLTSTQLAQNVVVELNYRVTPSPSSGHGAGTQQSSVFVGWNGLQ